MSSNSDSLVSMRTAITLVLIIIGIIIMMASCLVFISAPCVSNFYNQLPEYPGAELIEQRSSTLNWIAVGDLEFIYHTDDDAETVEDWFNQNVEQLYAEALRAQTTGETAPDTWDHYYILEASPSGGTNITLTASCLN